MGYRENIMNRVRLDAQHPVHKGIKMQAHHLVSKKGVKLTGLKSELEGLGYDINVCENLVLLPSTLKGACHLKVQLHRGNHTAAVPDDLWGDDDDDDDHGNVYHALVLKKVLSVKREIDKGRLCGKPPASVQHLFDELSADILDQIRLFLLPLSSIHLNFQPLAKSGCCGEDATPDAVEVMASNKKAGRKTVCPDQRDHRGQEGITYPMRPGAGYSLEVGQ